MLGGSRSWYPGRLTVRDWLKRIGFHYQQGKAEYAVTDTRKARIRECLIDFSEAFLKQKARTHVIIYINKCYIHVLHRSKFSFYHQGESRSANAAGKEKRIIINHAIIKDGLDRS